LAGQAEISVKQISQGLYYFTGLIAGRSYLIEDPDGLTLVDAGLALATAKILRQIEALGRQASDLKRILVTHAHPDHVGGLPKLQALTGAVVCASAVEKPVIEGKAPVRRPARQDLSMLSRLIALPEQTIPGTPVARVVADGEILDEVLGGLQAIASPGHSLGHLAFWQPARRVLFCGDVITRFRNLGLPFAAFTVDMEENKRSLRRLADLEPAIICFGHGNPLTHDTAITLREFARNLS
jgi:glyoxylase-like metal-dependent hydrolase (beta-lactamase superfamily II)